MCALLSRLSLQVQPQKPQPCLFDPRHHQTGRTWFVHKSRYFIDVSFLSIFGNAIRAQMPSCHLDSPHVAKMAQIWPFHGSRTLSEVKLEARPLPWQDMNHWGEASSVLV